MRKLRMFAVIFAALMLLAVPARAEGTAEDALSTFFKSLDASNYAKAWDLLTDKSKTFIAEAVKAELDSVLAEDNSEESQEARQLLTADLVRGMFATGDNEIVETFWKGFCEGFEKSGHTIKSLAEQEWVHAADSGVGDECVLATDMEGTDGMRMFKVNGEWKIGLIEAEQK
ncbi:MAG: hypothetical protein K6G50_02340 [bacterium]|nr:hypothetical protein [bacterium]